MKRSRAPSRAYKVNAASFDHFIGALLQPCRDFKAECLRCPEAHDQLELGRLYDRQVARLGALENAASATIRLRWLSKNGSPGTTSPSARSFTSAANASSSSCSVLALRICSLIT